MVSRVVMLLSDDLDGGDATETVKFGLDGTVYEIDLSDPHAEELRTFLNRYIGAGRRIGKMYLNNAGAKSTAAAGRRPERDAWLDAAATRGPAASAVSNSTKEERTEIRAWAATFGVQVAERGRIKDEIVQAWRSKDPTIMGVQPPAPKPTPPPKKAPAAKAAPAKTNGKAVPAKSNGKSTKAVPAAKFSAPAKV